jgi:predicted Rossmann-fold nucleotide-binding protein
MGLPEFEPAQSKEVPASTYGGRVQPPRRRTIREVQTVEELLAQQGHLRDCAVQGLDLSGVDVDWSSLDVQGSLFLGCVFPSEQAESALEEHGAKLFPRFEERPYNPYRSSLYTPDELESADGAIHDWYMAAGRYLPDISEALAQRVHDLAIDDALGDLIGATPEARLERRIVGIMGGHAAQRGTPEYDAAARVGWLLGSDHLVVTGGGPGIMEAGNLGAYMSARSEADLGAALERLAAAPGVDHADYRAAADEVRVAFPSTNVNLAVPTWFYGFEPVNLFASHIAKYFANSIREDGLLAICLHGIVFAPGSAGTVQEIFADAAQNQYTTFDYRSPMAFLGLDRWRPPRAGGIYPALVAEAQAGGYADLLTVSDSPDEVVEFIRSRPPGAAPRRA